MLVVIFVSSVELRMTSGNSTQPVSNLGDPKWRLTMLVALLLPFAWGAIWVARQGNHGAPVTCCIDSEGKFATFIWFGSHRRERPNPLGPVADFRFRTVDLRTGRLVASDRHPIPFTAWNWQDSWAIAVLGDNRFEVVRLNIDPQVASPPIQFSIPQTEGYKSSSMIVAGDRVLVAQQSQSSSRIIMLDPRSHDFEVVAEARDSTYENLLSVRDDLFYTWGSTASGKATKRLIRFGRMNDGKVTLFGHWGSSFIGYYEEAGELRVVNQSQDGLSFEIRNAETRDLRGTIALPQSAVLAAPAARTDAAVAESWLQIGRPNAAYIWDLNSRSLLSIPEDTILRNRSQASKRLLVVATRNQLHAQLIDEQRSEAIAAFQLRERFVDARFVDEGRQLWVADASQRLMLLDASTGKVLRIVAPWWFVPYLEVLTAVGFFVWAGAWVHFAAKAHRYAWIDCAWLTGLCIAYIILRSRTIGFGDDVVRPIYQFAEGTFASWLILAALWLVLGRTRVSLRPLPLIGVAALAVLFSLITTGFENVRVWELIIAVELMCVWLILACLPLRWMGYRFLLAAKNEEDPLSKPEATSSSSTVPMRDLFLLTTVLAGVMALGRLVPPAMQVSFQEMANLLVLVVSVTLTGLFAARAGLSQRRFGARVITLLIATLIAMALPLAWTAVYQGLPAVLSPDVDFLWWEARLHTSTAIVTVVCLYAFRLRGWRLAVESWRREEKSAGTALRLFRPTIWFWCES